LRAAFPPPDHDHRRCVDDVLERACKALEEKGLKFTPLRESLLREIASSHQAIGVYELIERLRHQGLRVTSSSIYPVIDVFLDAGVVRRFRTRNAYYVHGSGGSHAARVVLACQTCGIVADVGGTGVLQAINRAAAVEAFEADAAVIEVAGVCTHCAKNGERRAPIKPSRGKRRTSVVKSSSGVSLTAPTRRRTRLA
jgi:Fur family transcriptional regulator, zinc uptake regulator